jgi:hypothetical protein
VRKAIIMLVLVFGLLVPSVALAEVNLKISSGEAISRANAQLNAPSWSLKLCSNSFAHEHTTAYKCYKGCLNAPFDGHRLKIKHKTKTVHRGKKHVRIKVHVYIGGFMGRLQIGHSWNPNHSSECNTSHKCSTCSHSLSDWRNCPECSAYRFLLGAKTRGRKWIAGQWGQTCFQ